MEYQEMNELEALTALYDSGDRFALTRLSELRGVDYCLDKQKDTDIRVMTANLLWARWDSEDKELKKYPIRMKRTAELFNMFKPDFIGLQEAKQMMREPLDIYLDTSYEYVVFDPPKQNAEWFPILYRADRWRPVDSGTGKYSETKHPWGYVWATFSRTDNENDMITVMNLHYTLPNYASIDVSWGEYRNALAEELNDTVRRQLIEAPNVPIVITGDYNTGRYTELYEIMVNDLPIEDAPLLTENTNYTYEKVQHPSYIDHISVSRELVDVICHRCLDYNPYVALSDHSYYFADIRKH